MKYIQGFIVGMLMEYLIRVNPTSVFAQILLVLNLLGILIHILSERSNFK